MAQIRQEITVAGTGGILGSIAQLDTTQYSGTVTYYFEAVMSGQGIGGDVVLRRFGTTTDDATITYLAADVNKRRRSSSFTPPAGQTQYIIAIPTGSGALKAGRIIIIQNGSPITSTETQIEIGSREVSRTNTASTPLTYPQYWLYTAANWSGTKVFYGETTYSVATSKLTCTIKLQEDDGSFGSWADKVTIVNAGNSTAYARIRATFTPTDGRHYRLVTSSSSSKSAHTVNNARIIVDQTNSPTQFELQYLMLNSVDNNLAQDQGYDTLFDANEWSGVTNFYYHAHDASNSADSSRLKEEGNGYLANSTVTGANQQISAAIVLNDDTEIDTNVITSTGNIAASRILVKVSPLWPTPPVNQPLSTSFPSNVSV